MFGFRFAIKMRHRMHVLLFYYIYRLRHQVASNSIGKLCLNCARFKVLMNSVRVENVRARTLTYIQFVTFASRNGLIALLNPLVNGRAA